MVPDKWSTKILGELTSIYDGTHSTPDYKEYGVPFYSVENISKNNFADTKFVSEEAFARDSVRAKIERNDILMTRIGDVGNSKLVDWDARASFYVSLALIKGCAALHPRYLAQYMKSSRFQREVHKRKLHLAFPQKINLGDIGHCEVLVPPIPEQKKIADVLEAWDGAIENTEKLIKNSKAQKKALMQQLLTGRKRLPGFEGEWDQTRLRELLVEKRGRNREGNVSRVLSVSNKRGFILPEEQFSKRVASDDTSNYLIVRKGQYAYNPSRINVGSFARLDTFDEGLVSPMYVVFATNNAQLDNDFFNHWMQSHEAQGRISNLTQGSVRDSVSFDSLGSLHIRLPSLREQQAISVCLSTCDQEIAALLTDLGQLQTEKKALMQQLLTGKRRVKV